jgi:hypothetical protein
MRTRRLGVVAFLAAVVFGCTSSPAPSASALPSESSGTVQGTLPEDCDQIDLRSPTGERVDLTGVWEGDGALVDSDETFWLVQVGDCVYGSAMNPRFLAQAGDGSWTVANLQGHLTSDFRLAATAVILIAHPPYMAVASDLTFLVDWDDEGRIQLHEDREAGEVAARCRPLPLGNCPAPLILERVDGQVVPSTSPP